MENHGGVEEETPRPQNLYTIFLLVLVFIVTGLMGILLCHILQEKGYRCRTSRERENRLDAAPDDVQETHESNQDTVGQIVQCIIGNEANIEALKELLQDHEQVKVPALRFRVTHVGKTGWVQEASELAAREQCSRGQSVVTEAETKGEKCTDRGEIAASEGPVPVGPTQVCLLGV
uniref:RELT-like protein 1 isoform X2 n=1 Tax=Pristiophorus japonicus TaxID=55135 RepID=UPI00398F2EB5